MVPPRHCSMSPLLSFCSTRSTPSLAESLRMIWAWWSGKRCPVPLRRQIAEARLIDGCRTNFAEADNAAKAKR